MAVMQLHHRLLEGDGNDVNKKSQQQTAEKATTSQHARGRRKGFKGKG
jgi:hypothetical protein